MSDNYKNFIYYKHLYLHTPFGENFSKSVVRCGGVMQKVANQVREKEVLVSKERANQDDVIGNKSESIGGGIKNGIIDEKSGEVEDETKVRQQTKEKEKEKEKEKGGFFKSLFDKVDNLATSNKLVSDLISKPKHSSKSLKEIEEHYVGHLDLFMRIGLIFGSNDDYESQLSQRDTQIASLTLRVQETVGYVSEYIRDRGVDMASLGLEEEDVASLVELIFFSSLHLQETKVGTCVT